MSTAYSSAKQQYIGNGVTTEWGFDFPIQKHSELKVYLKRSGSTQVLLEEGVDYSFVTENTIAFPIKTGEAKLQATDVLALQRESVFESEYNFSNQQRLEPEEVMHADDNLERQIQELKRDVTQAIRIQPTSNIDTDEYFIAVESIYENLDNITNVSGISSEIVNCSDNISDISTVSSNIANVNAVGLSISNVNTVAGNVSSVNTVAGVSTDVTAVAGIAGSVPTVANNDANITTVATNISDVNTAATNITAIQDAYNNANTAQTMATQASQSASEAAQSATNAAISAAGTHFKLFHHQWFDYELNDLAWLRADTFSWQSGTVYTNAYNHLVDDIDGITPSTETVGGQTVTFYRATDGHKIVLANQETTVNNIYTATGVAWYYILDTVNNRFKLPRTKYDFNGLRGNVGDYIPESLPNITGNSGALIPRSTSGSPTGALKNTGSVVANMASGNNIGSLGLGFDASLSSSTYQNNAPVQQRGTQQYLYFYVGQYTQSAIEQTAGLNSELFNNKIDIDGNNVITAGANKILNTSSYTTNRILEIPQDIKLELNNGTLTLKAGSKVYVPNGSGNFDVITTTQDYAADTSAYSGMYVLAFTNGNPTGVTIITNPVSGDTAPTSPVSLQGWYDTTNNLVKRYNNGWQTQIHSFPLAICTSDGTSITSIDQIFNGFGYIGSTVFALPGVKVQYPNGKNEYGTCNSGIIVNSKVNLWSATGTAYVDIVLLQNGIFGYTKTNLFYDSEKNIIKHKNGSIIYGTTIASCWNKDTVVSDFLRYDVDSVVNSNASNFSQAGRSYLSGLGMPSSKYIDLTLGATGSTYTAPGNGYFSILGAYDTTPSQTNPVFISMSCGGITTRNSGTTETSYGVYISAKKGQSMFLEHRNFKLTGYSYAYFRFIYAQGEQ